MKSRTLISFCQRPLLNPFQGESTFSAMVSWEVVALIVNLHQYQNALVRAGPGSFSEVVYAARRSGLTARNHFFRRAWAASMATAQLAIRALTLSARLVRMIGTRAPSTKPALSAFARNVSCFARMLPASRSGARRISGSPATAERIPFVLAAFLLMALSNAIGPSRIAPLICP